MTKKNRRDKINKKEGELSMFYEPKLDVSQTPRYVYYENIYAPLHFHQAIELVYCLGGTFQVQSGLNQYMLNKDEIAFFPSYFPHGLTPLNHTKSITFILPLKYFEIFSKNDVELVFQKLDNAEVNLKIKALIEECNPLINEKAKNANQPDFLFQAYAQAILALVLEHYDSPFKGNVKQVQKNNALIIEIIQYIENHYKEKLTLDTLAAHFGYSKWYFSRLFNNTFKCSLPLYINSIRCSKIAKNKDKTTNKTYTILDEGFSSLSTYYKSKKKKEQLLN